jgi:hypothetical protein
MILYKANNPLKGTYRTNSTHAFFALALKGWEGLWWFDRHSLDSLTPKAQQCNTIQEAAIKSSNMRKYFSLCQENIPKGY